MSEECAINDFTCMKYLNPALMILPDFANSRLLRWKLPVLLAEPCTLCADVKLVGRGTRKSYSDDETTACVSVPRVISATVPKDTADSLSSVHPKKAAAINTGSRYFSNLFMSDNKYRQI